MPIRMRRVADRSLCLLPTVVTGRQRSAMYDHVGPCSSLYVSRHNYIYTYVRKTIFTFFIPSDLEL